jgi:predicted amidohydrolase
MNDHEKPYIDENGTIVIPFNIDQKYHFWSGGQKLAETMKEIQAPEDVWRKYLKIPYPGGTGDSA